MDQSYNCNIPYSWSRCTLSFLCSQISAVATDETASSLVPISGHLLYPDGARNLAITLTTKDDLIPEPSTMFQLQLTSSNGGSRIDPLASSAAVTGN